VADKKIKDQKLQGVPSLQKSEAVFKSQLEVDAFMKKDLHKCSKKDISDLFRISAKASKKNTKISPLKNHLPAIAFRIKELTPLDWTLREISGLVYGLRYKTGDNKSVLDILSAMTHVTTKCTQNIEIMQSMQVQHISMLLYGLQNMHSSEKVIRNLLSVVAIMISKCSINFDAQAIGNSLYGLKSMSNDCSEVRDILSALCIKIRDCDKDLSSLEVSNALHGLQGMSSDCSEVRDVLSSLSVKIRSCTGDFNSEEVGNALYGLQGMSSDCSEVRDVLSALTVKICSCKDDLRSHDVGNALYGFQGMSSEYPEVKDALTGLVDKISGCKDNLSAHTGGNALYGLQGIKWRAGSPEFPLVLLILHRHISRIVDNVCKSKDLSALTEDPKHTNRAERRQVIADNLMRSAHSSSQKGTKTLVSLCQSLTFFLSEQSKISETLEYGTTITTMREFRDFQNMNVKIVKELSLRRKSGDIFYKSSEDQSVAGRRMYESVVKATQNNDIKIHANKYLFDLFDSDFVLYISTNDYNEDSQTPTIINIEIDGIHQNKNKLFCRRKDEYLKSRGVFVSRINVDTVKNMEDAELEKWILETISSVNLEVSSRD
jgi:hypothetical protein